MQARACTSAADGLVQVFSTARSMNLAVERLERCVWILLVQCLLARTEHFCSVSGFSGFPAGHTWSASHQRSFAFTVGVHVFSPLKFVPISAGEGQLAKRLEVVASRHLKFPLEGCDFGSVYFGETQMWLLLHT